MIESDKKVLLLEAVKFMEICQTALLNGKLDKNNYYFLTNVKIGLICRLAGTERNLDKELACKLDRVFSVNNNVLGRQAAI